MKLVHRKVDFVADRDYILECHCRINYECECPWKREMSYQDYKDEWFSLKSQVDGFFNYLSETALDERSIVEIIEDDIGNTVGFLWVPFNEDKEIGFCFAEIQDVYIEESYRKIGVATELLKYAENKARECGANVIRSGTGCENRASILMHEKLGYYQYRYEFEKVL